MSMDKITWAEMARQHNAMDTIYNRDIDGLEDALEIAKAYHYAALNCPDQLTVWLKSPEASEQRDHYSGLRGELTAWPHHRQHDIDLIGTLLEVSMMISRMQIQAATGQPFEGPYWSYADHRAQITSQFHKNGGN